MPVKKKGQTAARLARCLEEAAAALLWLLRGDPGESLDPEPPPRPLGVVCDTLAEMLAKGWKEDRRPAELNDAGGRKKLVGDVITSLEKERLVDLSGRGTGRKIRLLKLGRHEAPVKRAAALAAECRT